jgi:hypothetical protein
VAAWKALWRGGLAGGERESEMRESDQTYGSGDLGFFFLYILMVGRAGIHPTKNSKPMARSKPE